MHKVILLVWDVERLAREVRRVRMLEQVAPALLDAGVRQLGVDVVDEHAKVASPTPFPLGARRPTAMVNA